MEGQDHRFGRELPGRANLVLNVFESSTIVNGAIDHAGLTERLDMKRGAMLAGIR